MQPVLRERSKSPTDLVLATARPPPPTLTAHTAYTLCLEPGGGWEGRLKTAHNAGRKKGLIGTLLQRYPG